MAQNYNIPELDSGQREIERRQRVADAMAAQGMQPLETNQMAGGYVVPVSPLAAIAKMAQAYAGKSMGDSASKDREGLDAKYREGLANAVKEYMAGGSKTIQAPDIGAMTGGLDQQDVPMNPETIKTDPRERVIAAMTSQYAPVRDMAKLDYQMSEKKADRAEDRSFRSEQAQLAREQRRQELELRLQDARTNAADRAAMQKELAQMNIEARRDMAAQANATRRDIAEMARAQGGKPPPGYRMTPDGNLEAIPGGPADQKQQGAFNQDTAALTGGIGSMDRLATAANEAMNHPGLAGITGLRGALPNIPGSAAADAQAKLNTLKSQVAFGVLQDMRNNSKTGGALGSVSDAEGKRLEANLAALENAQSVEQMKDSLKKIIEYTGGAKDRLQGAFNLKHQTRRATDKPASNGSSGGWAIVK